MESVSRLGATARRGDHGDLRACASTPPGGAQRLERLPGARRRHRHQHGPDPGVRGGRARRPRRARGPRPLGPARIDRRRPAPPGPMPMAAVCKAIAHGSLMGARGNSGVILCQLLRGLTGVLAEGQGEVDGPGLARGLAAASDAARQAVLRPVEGTILTVARAAAEGAEQRARSGAALWSRCSRRRIAPPPRRWLAPPSSSRSWPRPAWSTPVGRATCCCSTRCLSVIDGRPLPPAPAGQRPRRSRGSPTPCPQAGLETEGSECPRQAATCATRSCTSSRPPTTPCGPSRRCGPASGTPSSWWAARACGTATSTPTTSGASIEAALDAGRPRDIRVTDLAEQVEEERWVREGAGVPAGGGVDAEPPPRTAVVAVANGEGIGRIFRSLGVHHFVPGGQSMNPSTAQILEVVESVPSAEVVLLPNNDNIRPVAMQVCELATKTVRVVPTSGIVEGFAALLEYDPEAGAPENAVAMAESARRVVAGEVTRAVRDATGPAGPIHTGDWMGLSRDGVEVVGDLDGRGHLRAPRQAPARRARARDPDRGGGRRARARHGGSPSGWPSTVPTWPWRSTTAGNRCTRSSSASSEPRPRPRVPGEDRAPHEAQPEGRMLSRLAEIPVREVHEGRRQAGRGTGGHRHHERPRPHHPLPAPLHRPDPPGRRGRACGWARSRWCSPASTPVRTRRTRQGRALVELDVDDGTGALRVTFFNQAWRAKPAARRAPRRCSSASSTRTGASASSRTPSSTWSGNRTGRIVPIYPTSEKAGIAGWEFGEWVEEALRRAGALYDPLSARWRAELELMDRTDGVRRPSTPRSPFAEQERARRRLAFDELLRLQLEVVMRRHVLERDSRGIRHVVAPAAGRGRLSSTPSSRSCPSPSPAPQRRAVDEISADLAKAAAHAPPAAGRRRVGQDRGGAGRVAGGGPRRPPGGAHGPHRGPGRAALPGRAGAARRTSSCPTPERSGGSRPLAVALLTNRTPAGERAKLHQGLRQRRRSISWSGPTRCSPRRCGSRASGSWSSTSSTASASSSATRCGPRDETRPRARAPIPTCSS